MQVSDNPTVLVRNVSKTFTTTNSSQPNKGKRPFSRRSKVSALSQVSLIAETGDCIGILGRNGSGKSTLLRLIAGGDVPETGEIYVSAQPTLLGVSAALQPQLTGIQNIRLGLLAQGLSPSHVRDLENSVAEFADIGDAIYRPMDTYSSGMGARLKFAIATAIKREILLVDEALSTGDAGFSGRARDRMNSFLDGTGTIFLVSHSAATISEMANRAIWLHDGEVISDGAAEEVALQYRQWAHRTASGKKESAADVLQSARAHYNRPNIVLESELVEELDA